MLQLMMPGVARGLLFITTGGLRRDGRTLWPSGPDAAEQFPRRGSAAGPSAASKASTHNERKWAQRWRKRWGGKIKKVRTRDVEDLEIRREKAAQGLSFKFEDGGSFFLRKTVRNGCFRVPFLGPFFGPVFWTVVLGGITKGARQAGSVCGLLKHVSAPQKMLPIFASRSFFCPFPRLAHSGSGRTG